MLNRNKFQRVLPGLGLALAIGLAFAPPAAASPRAAKVPVTIQGIDVERGGRLLVMLFARDGFPVQHDRALSIQSVPVNAASVRVDVPLVGDADEYAIKVLHDQDGNGRVSKNMIGLPAEGLGFSSGARLLFGPPKFNAARFARAASGQAQRIRLQYL